MSWVRNFMVRQLGRPAGLFGRLLLRLLNSANKGMNEATIARLALTPEDRLLEIGFGGGDLLAAALDAGLPVVAGIDHAGDAVRTVGRRLAQAMTEGRLSLLEADAAQIPAQDQAFTAVCAVNAVYFWPDPDAVLQEALRVLEPGGRLVLAHGAAPFEGQIEGARQIDAETLARLMGDAGFVRVTSEADHDKANGPFAITIGYRPG